MNPDATIGSDKVSIGAIAGDFNSKTLFLL